MRSILNSLEPNQVINPVMDSLKLRQFVSKYKRHTIQRPMRPLNIDPSSSLSQSRSTMRMSAADYFFVYTR
jgi:hypothetical protein